MAEIDLKTALLTRRARLVEQIKSLTRQLKACDTMLAGLDADDAPPPTDAEISVVLGPSAPNPSTLPAAAPVAPPEPVAPPPPPPPPKIGPSAEELAQLEIIARTDRRGSRIALAELVIARCGDTFSLRDFMDILIHQMHWRGHEDQMASAFWKAVQRRGYILIKPGSGRTPALYGKIRPPTVEPPKNPSENP
jgi:hypothetical protein